LLHTLGADPQSGALDPNWLYLCAAVTLPSSRREPIQV
jgi:hypothetical protein